LAIPTWPVGLPSRPRGGTFQIVKPFREPLRTEMDEGEQRARPLTSVRVATLSFNLFMTPAQAVSFLDFVETTLIDGTLKFTMPVLKPSVGMVERTVRFVSTPQPRDYSVLYYDVPMTIDVWSW